MSDTQTPLWRWLAVGALCGIAAAYFLATGEIALDKAHRTIITRAAQPLGYWAIVVVLTVLGALALRQAWLRMRSH